MLVSQLLNHPPVTLEFAELNYSVSDSSSKKEIKTVKLHTGYYLSAGGFGSYVGKRMKRILKDASGKFIPGELTAIMGPSGAGKSTLMNILAGYKTHNVQGSISVNGKSRELAQFRKMSGYIMQDDVLHDNLTVYESMRYAAQLKLPRKTPKSQIEQLIKEILDIIGLTECQNVKASKISGGQRKRLSIALELINNPPIMFFDEPTSGLDSASCYSCVNILKALAKGGRTIIATIHQPSARIFEQFDSLYLLGEGRCLYSGLTKAVVPYLALQGLQCPAYHNPADFVIEIASGDYGHQWIQILAKATALSSDSGVTAGSLAQVKDKMEENSSRTDKPHVENMNEYVLKPVADDSRLEIFFHQFFILLRRSFLCISRDKMLTHLRFSSVLLIGFLVGAIYYNIGNDANKVFDNAGNLYFGLLFVVLSSMTSTVLTFPLERGVLVREHLNCWYSLKSYFLARTCADLPFQCFFPFLYVAIIYYLTDQPQEAFRFWIVAGMHVGISLVAQSFSMLVGAFCQVQSAVFIGPILSIPLFLFTGFFVSVSEVPAYLRWLAWFSYPRYCFQSTLTAVYGFERETLSCHQPYCHFKHPKRFLDIIGAADIDVVQQSLCVVAILVVVRILAYYGLRFKIMMEKQ